MIMKLLQVFYLISQSLWIEKTLMSTEYTFPGKLRWFEIKSVQSVSLTGFLFCFFVLLLFFFGKLPLKYRDNLLFYQSIARQWNKVKINQKIYF